MSSSRTITRVFWRALQGLLYLVLLGAIAFFGLTRTEVGRDELRQQIEARFDDQFTGSLHIARLQGNLVNDLYASDVRILDANGERVVSVDSVTLRPRWTQLLARELSVRQITLHRPEVHAHRDRNGSWSIQSALRRTRPSSDGPGLGISVADVRVQNGRVTTTRDGAAPETVREGWLFDYTRAGVENLNANGTIDWSGGEKLIEAYDVTFDVPDAGLSFAAVQGQVVRENDTWTLRQTRIATGATDIRVSGSVAMNETGEPNLDISLADSRIDFDEVHRVVPRSPLRDLVSVRGRIIGPPSSFLLDDVEVRHGASRINIEGTALGLPDSLDYDVRVSEAELQRADVETVWGRPLPERLATVDDALLSFFSRGVIDLSADRPTPFDVSASLTAETNLGAARGDVAVQRRPGRAVQYSAELDVDSLNLGPVTGRPQLAGAITGRITGTGRGIRTDSLDTDLSLQLRPSSIGQQRLDTARVDITLTGRVGEARIMLDQAGAGTLSLNARVDARAREPDIRLTADARGLDLAPLPGTLPASSLFARLETRSRGGDMSTLTGSLSLQVDSSRIASGDSLHILPPHRVTVDLTEDGDDRPRLRVDGTVLGLTATGDLDTQILPAVAGLWQREFQDALRLAADKPMPAELASAGNTVVRTSAAATEPDSAVSTPDADAGLSLSARRDSVRGLLQDGGMQRPLDIGLNATIRDAAVLRLWLPMLPPLTDGLSSTLNARADADTLALRATVHADAYATNQVRADSLRAILQMNASLDRPLVASTSTRFDVIAHEAAVGSLSVAAPRLSARYQERSGELRLSTDRKGNAGPFTFEAGLNVRASRNVITVRDLSATVGELSWRHSEASTIDVYGDGIVVEPLVIQSPRPETDEIQRVQISGRLSPREGDRLVARAENVLLHPVSELLKLNRPIAGRLDGEVELTGRWNEPIVQADLTVGRFSFDRRLLGVLGLRASYQGSPDVGVSLRIEPDTTASGPELVPGGVRTAESNSLTLDGRIRLPMAGADTLAGDPLDLNLTVDRADLFFFEYIFQDTVTKVSGYTAGRAHIGGSFTDPRFDADMRVEEGAFTLPDFNLNYRIAGDVMVDDAGIHLAGVRIDDSDDGVADIDGSILFNDYRFFSFDLAGQLREMTVIDVEDSDDLPFYGTIRASGPATLTGPLPDATLRSPGARTTPDSELYIPVLEEDVSEESGYIIFADSTGQLPDLRDLTRRDNLLADRPVGEPSFLDGLELDLNILAPQGSTVHLVFDPLVGDVVTAIGSGRVQLQRQEGEFFVYGTYEVEGGDYLFTAGEVFVRKFSIDGGTLTWDGDPVNAVMNLSAAYRTRASPAGLPNEEQYAGRIPVIVELDITGRVETPRVDLSLAVARDQRSGLIGDQTLDAILNQDDLATEYATSVLLTNTFLLTTSTLTTGGASDEQSRIAEAGNQLAFNSVSQLVASQLNRYLSEALPNVDVSLGVSGEDPEDLDIIYGVALRLLNERLIIRGEGVYTGNEPDETEASGPQGEFVVEVRLSRSVSVEVFYRRAGDDVTRQTLTNTTGAGLSYQTEFSTWKRLFYQLFGWLLPGDGPQPDTDDRSPPEPEPDEAVAQREDNE
ncbi:translocation/assembly module TamB domain-containing protein [Longibacter sp.]|uniref:translocation/assembly module TamB domain-containing protein n=1 Tax=Longibacter sp. TaxID=2045415 RepID=UPI003EB7B2C1